jgi:hypothetical protein
MDRNLARSQKFPCLTYGVQSSTVTVIRDRAYTPDRAIKSDAHDRVGMGWLEPFPIVLDPCPEVFDRFGVSPSLVLAGDNIGMRLFVHVRPCPLLDQSEPGAVMASVAPGTYPRWLLPNSPQAGACVRIVNACCKSRWCDSSVAAAPHFGRSCAMSARYDAVPWRTAHGMCKGALLVY